MSVLNTSYADVILFSPRSARGVKGTKRERARQGKSPRKMLLGRKQKAGEEDTVDTDEYCFVIDVRTTATKLR